MMIFRDSRNWLSLKTIDFLFDTIDLEKIHLNSILHYLSFTKNDLLSDLVSDLRFQFRFEISGLRFEISVQFEI